MTRGERDARILDFVRSRGRVTVDELSEELGVGASSVRRLLHRLARDGRLTRTYGGATAPDGSDWATSPTSPDTIEKQLIADAAAELVVDGQTIAVTSGRTAVEFARRLVRKRELTVITNSLDVAQVLLDREGIQLVVLGGVVRPRMHSLLGHLTELACREMRADTLFMGVGGLSVTRGLMNDYMPEVVTDRALRPMATSVVVMAESKKFDIVGPAFVFGLDQVDVLVTDAGVRRETVHGLTEAGVRVIVAEQHRGAGPD